MIKKERKSWKWLHYITQFISFTMKIVYLAQHNTFLSSQVLIYPQKWIFGSRIINNMKNSKTALSYFCCCIFISSSTSPCPSLFTPFFCLCRIYTDLIFAEGVLDDLWNQKRVGQKQKQRKHSMQWHVSITSQAHRKNRMFKEWVMFHSCNAKINCC